MSEVAKKRRPWKRWGALALLIVMALPVALLVTLSIGVLDNSIRRAIVDRIAQTTGKPAELEGFHFNPWRLSVVLSNLTIHGLEPAGTPPLFHADRLEVGLRVDSWWGRKFSVRDVSVSHPQIHVRINGDGASNVPELPAQAPVKPMRERLFEVVVQRLRVDDGELLYNDVRVPLVVQAGRFDFALDYGQADGRPAYLGQFHGQSMEFAAQRYLPFSSDVAVRFALSSDSLSVTQLVWTGPHSSIDAQFGVSKFAQPEWTFRYRGHLELQDIRTILRQPTTPDGRVDFSGDGRYSGVKLALTGSYSAAGISLPYEWFHTKDIASRGSYHADERSLEIPDFSAQAFSGGVTGQVHLDFQGLKFRADTHAQNFNLAAVFATVNNPNLPIVPLHWNGLMDVQSVTTWEANFQDLDSRGISLWTPPAELREREIPVNAHINYHYSAATQSALIESSEISSPTSRLEMNGSLAGRDSAMDVTLDTQDLLVWDDFITAVRGDDAEPKIISGKANWQGRLTCPIVGPTFAGHVKGTEARYEQLYWDQLEGDMTYSPEGFSIARASASRGTSSAQFEYSMALDDWGFLPESKWSFDATLVRTDTAGLQALFGLSYPVHGMLSGNFHGKGTHADPEWSGLFDIIEPEAWGWHFDRARGEIAFGHGELRVSNAELRLLPPPSAGGAQATEAPGLLTGNFLFRTTDHQTVFDLTGAGLPLEGISQIQTPSMPIGGRLSLQLRGSGSLLSPTLQGTVRLVDLRLGSEVPGSFEGTLNSNGSRLTLDVDSAMATGALHGTINVSLGGDYPLQGQLTAEQLDVDPFITSALHLGALTNHSRVDGQFTISGALLHPESLIVAAELSHLALEYESIKLENQGPVKFHYGGHEIRVEQADLRGTDTDFHISGFARFAGDRAVDLRLAGALNLGLIGAFVPGLDSRGPAQIDAGIAGTLSNPRITGRVHVENASARFGDFPVGLSQVGGDFVFDTSRLVFDNVTAQGGGGRLQIVGSLTYGNGPLRYDLTATSEQVRIRYPVGMSWLADGTLRFAGTGEAATLSGHVTVNRLLMSENLDLTSFAGSPTEGVAAPTTASPFLRNLQFDIQADSTPGARLEWSSGRFQTEASVRVRGTWEHPILLGDIHLVSGQMNFRGSQYQLSRGDINFVNPFRLDPVVNVEATTTIQRYAVTIDFTGQASRLTMSYRSDPPLPSSDIVNLLALGQTGEESQLRGTGAVQTPELGATTLLSQAVSSQLGGRIQRLFGISHFSVDPSYVSQTTASQSPGARVAVAQQFSRGLVITYSTDVTSTQYQIIQIEYTIRPDLSVVALRDANGTFGIDVVRRNRFK